MNVREGIDNRVGRAHNQNMTTTNYTVITQHGIERTVRRHRFADYDTAVAYAEAHNPDTDSSMVPTLDEPHASHPDYEKGCYWFGNLYAVITRKGNRSRR